MLGGYIGVNGSAVCNLQNWPKKEGVVVARHRKSRLKGEKSCDGKNRKINNQRVLLYFNQKALDKSRLNYDHGASQQVKESYDIVERSVRPWDKGIGVVCHRKHSKIEDKK